MTYDASSRKDIRKAEKAAALAASADIDVLRWIMAAPPGRAWMYRFLATAGLFHEPFVPTNQHATAFNLGRINVAKPIWGLIFQHCPNQYVLMMQEQELTDHVRSTPDHPDAVDGPATGASEPGRDDPGSIDDADYGHDPAVIVGADGIIHWPGVR
jgi:hypothetical protein